MKCASNIMLNVLLAGMLIPSLCISMVLQMLTVCMLQCEHADDVVIHDPIRRIAYASSVQLMKFLQGLA